MLPLWLHRAQDGGQQRFRFERLGEMAVHAGVAAFGDLVGEGLSGQGDDGYLPTLTGKRADAACRLQTVHSRHAHVHQHDVEIRLHDCLDRLRAAFHAGRPVTGDVQESAGDVPVHCGIVDDEHVQAVWRRHRLRACGFGGWRA